MIIGWNLSDTLNTIYVIQAVKDAVAVHGTGGTTSPATLTKRC